MPIEGEDCVVDGVVAAACCCCCEACFGVREGEEAERRLGFFESVCCLFYTNTNVLSIIARRKIHKQTQNTKYLRIRFTSFLIIERGDSSAPRFFNALKNDASDCNSSTNGLIGHTQEALKKKKKKRRSHKRILLESFILLIRQ